MEDYYGGFAAVKDRTRLYVFRPIWIIMVVAAHHATMDCSRAQHELIDEGVIQKWKDYEAFSHGLQGTSREVQISNGVLKEFIYRFKQNRNCALSTEPHNRDPLNYWHCLLANPHYMATIDLSKTDPSNVVLLNYTPIPGHMDGLSPFEFAFMQTSRHFSYNAQTLRQTVSDPSFKVTRIAKETQNGQELVQVDHLYEYVRQETNEIVHERNRGSLWLDPSRCWCIRRSKLSTETMFRGERMSDIESDIVCETIDHPSGFPILKSITEQFKISLYKSNTKIEGSSKCDYELEVNESVPDSEFTLSAFGLPEPVGMEPVKKPIPMYLWLLLAAAVCGAIAFAFRYLAERKMPRPPTDRRTPC